MRFLWATSCTGLVLRDEVRRRAPINGKELKDHSIQITK